MILVSNHALERQYFPVPRDVTIRVNVAWYKTMQRLAAVLIETEHDIFLDYPQGRTKPPIPTIGLDETIQLTHQYRHVKYFAVSNVEDPDVIHSIALRLPEHTAIVPKIETQKGAEQFGHIVKETGVKHIMLDKEDLYFNIGGDSKLYEELIKHVRKQAQSFGVEVLELHGVIFGPSYITKKTSSVTGKPLKLTATV